MKPSYGEHYKALLKDLYAARIKSAAYRYYIKKEAASHIMSNPRLRYLLCKRAGLLGSIKSIASNAVNGAKKFISGGIKAIGNTGKAILNGIAPFSPLNIARGAVNLFTGANNKQDDEQEQQQNAGNTTLNNGNNNPNGIDSWASSPFGIGAWWARPWWSRLFNNNNKPDDNKKWMDDTIKKYVNQNMQNQDDGKSKQKNMFKSLRESMENIRKNTDSALNTINTSDGSLGAAAAALAGTPLAGTQLAGTQTSSVPPTAPAGTNNSSANSSGAAPATTTPPTTSTTPATTPSTPVTNTTTTGS